MRRRITHLFDSVDSIDPTNLIITKNSISSKKPITSAKEEKITLYRNELPEDFLRWMTLAQELHIKWVSEKSYQSSGPIVSKMSPGLHVFYTPQGDLNSSKILCSKLSEAFGEMNCVNPATSFTTLPADRFTNQTSYQYYTSMPSISNFANYLRYGICSQLLSDLSDQCEEYTTALIAATYLDISFTKSGSIVISSYRPTITHLLLVTTPNEFRSKFATRYEVGLLAPQSSREFGELSLSGLLTEVGDGSNPKLTMFSFPSQHHSTDMKFQAQFLNPSGMHPILQLNVTNLTPPLENQSCELFTYLTLPRVIFIDKYQFSDALFLADNNIAALSYIDNNVDLEAPDYALSLWGSSALIKLVPTTQKQIPSLGWTAQIPTHLRYLHPISNSSGLREIEIPYPVLFWACTRKDIHNFSINPFHRKNLGYDNFFDSKTLLYHLTPVAVREDGRLVNKLNVPVLNLDQCKSVESWTLIAISLGFLWVSWCLIKVWIRRGLGSGILRQDVKKKTA